MLGPGSLRVAGGLGGLAVCAASGVAVAVDAKPAAAPLKPPLAAPARSTSTTPGAGDALVIPSVPVCSASSGGQRTSPPPVPAALQPVADQLRKATTRRQRLAIYDALPADQRMQLAAYLQSLTRQGGGGRGGAFGCRGPVSVGAQDQAPVDPSVVAGGPAAPIVVSSVS